MFRTLGLVAIVCPVAIVLLVTGCDILELENLHANRSKWESQGFKHYRMELYPECLCDLAGNEILLSRSAKGRLRRPLR